MHGNSAMIIDMGMCLRVPSVQGNSRFLITPQGTCGKWHCMSPEICNNTTPFDGHAVDLWAAGMDHFCLVLSFLYLSSSYVPSSRTRSNSVHYVDWIPALGEATPDRRKVQVHVKWILSAYVD
jgi:hypothetical protein